MPWEKGIEKKFYSHNLFLGKHIFMFTRKIRTCCLWTRLYFNDAIINEKIIVVNCFCNIILFLLKLCRLGLILKLVILREPSQYINDSKGLVDKYAQKPANFELIRI